MQKGVGRLLLVECEHCSERDRCGPRRTQLRLPTNHQGYGLFCGRKDNPAYQIANFLLLFSFTLIIVWGYAFGAYQGEDFVRQVRAMEGIANKTPVYGLRDLVEVGELKAGQRFEQKFEAGAYTGIITYDVARELEGGFMVRGRFNGTKSHPGDMGGGYVELMGERSMVVEDSFPVDRAGRPLRPTYTSVLWDLLYTYSAGLVSGEPLGQELYVEVLDSKDLAGLITVAYEVRSQEGVVAMVWANNEIPVAVRYDGAFGHGRRVRMELR